MKFGYFDDRNKEYVITTPQTPLPWINYLGSEDFFSLVSNTAGGYSFYRDARMRRLTRYRYNSSPLDMDGHHIYIKDGDTVWIEPFRAKAFPILRDLMVDRSALDRIIAAGGYIDVRTGSAPNANNIAVEKVKADAAFDAAACIGCGACVASCKNASAMLFTSAKIAHLNLLPQGQPERSKRVLAMMKQMEAEGFGNCTNQYECEAACPKGISVDNIARLNRDFMRANAKEGLCF